MTVVNREEVLSTTEDSSSDSTPGTEELPALAALALDDAVNYSFGSPEKRQMNSHHLDSNGLSHVYLGDAAQHFVGMDHKLRKHLVEQGFSVDHLTSIMVNLIL